MSKPIVDTKVRTLIKAFLVFNRGKKYNGKQICEFINNGGFALNQHSVVPKTISYHVNAAKYTPGSMLYDVCVEKIGGYNHYWVD